MNVHVLYLDEVDSTNTYAVKNFSSLPDGTLVVSSMQTAGRGRRGRVWQSPRGVNIYASLVVKSLANACLAGAVAGLAVLDTVRFFCPEARPFLKWPNDVYIRERKISGILCESAEIANGRITGLAAGMGLNVNLDSGALALIDQPATSMRMVSGGEFDLNKVINRLEKSLNMYYIMGIISEADLFSEWKKANRLIGWPLELVDGAGRHISGVFADICDDGAMLLEREGRRERFDCGDVRIRRDSVNWDKI